MTIQRDCISCNCRDAYAARPSRIYPRRFRQRFGEDLLDAGPRVIGMRTSLAPVLVEFDEIIEYYFNKRSPDEKR